MRIGIVTTWFERGAAMVSRAIRDALVSQGHQVLIYARGGERTGQGDPRWDLPEVTWTRPAWTNIGSGTSVRWSHLSGWVRQHELEVVLFNEQQYWAPVVFMRRSLPGVAIGAYVDYYTAKTVPLFGLYDLLICNTRRHHGVFDWHPGALFIPWGTDCAAFPAACEPASDNGLVFFHSAGLSPGRKGTMTAVRAFAGLEGDCRLVVHLQAPLEAHPKLAALCASDPRVQLLTQTTGVPGLYHTGDIYVYPAILDGIGLTVAEALASGLPVITTGSPPMTEFVQHGVNGRHVPPHEHRGRADGYYWAESLCTPEAVREQMQFYLDHRDDLPRFKRAAREYATEHLDWSRNAASLGADIAGIVAARQRTTEAALENRALRSCTLPTARLAMRAFLDRIGLGHVGGLQRWLYSC